MRRTVPESPRRSATPHGPRLIAAPGVDVTLSPHRLIALCVPLAVGCVTAPPKPTPKPVTPPEQVVAEPPPPEALPEFAPAADAPPPRALLTLGLSRPVGRAVAEESRKKLTDYLSAQLGGEVQTRIFDSGDALAAAIVSGEVEAAWLTPLAYVRAAQQTPITPLVKLSRRGFTNYRSVIFAKKGTKAKKAADLKKKKMAWVGKGSASGRLFPEALLRRLKLDPDKHFAKQVEAADHKEVCQLVLDGKVDAGATLSDEVKDGEKPIPDGCREAGFDPAKFVVLERTDAIPNDVIAVRADVPGVVAEKVREALFDLSKLADAPKDIDEIFQADGFAPASDADFEVVREVEAMLKAQKQK